MKKRYISPESKKIEIDSQVLRMISQGGFVEVYWEELKRAREKDPRVTCKEVFDALNDKWYKVFKNFRYSNYISFRQILSKDPAGGEKDFG